MVPEIRIASIVGGFVAMYLLMLAHRQVVRRYWEPILEEEAEGDTATEEDETAPLDD